MLFWYNGSRIAVTAIPIIQNEIRGNPFLSLAESILRWGIWKAKKSGLGVFIRLFTAL